MKKTLLKVASFAYFFAGFFVIFSNNAHAYIDPSATTFLIQIAAGIVVAIGAAFTIFRHKIAALFRKKSDDTKQEIHLKEDIEGVDTVAKSEEKVEEE